MPILTIQGKRIQVDDSFNALSREQQDETVDEIAASLGVMPTAPPERGLGSLLTSGVGRGVSEMGILLGDELPAMVGRAVGADEYADRQLAEAEASKEKIQRENPASYKSYKDVKGVWDAIRYGTETIGEALPSIVTPFGVTGAVASIIGRYFFGRAIKAGAEKGLASAAGRTAARSAVVPTIAVTSAAQTIPEAYSDIRKETGQERLGASLVAGGINAALESIMPASILKGFSKEARAALTSNIAARVTGGVASGAVMEGLTEGTQAAVNKAAVTFVDGNKEFFTSDNWESILDQTIRGAIAGGSFKGVTSIPGPPSQPSVADKDALEAAELAAATPAYRKVVEEQEIADAEKLKTGATDALLSAGVDVKGTQEKQLALGYTPTSAQSPLVDVIKQIETGRGPGGEFIRIASEGTEFIAREGPGGFVVGDKNTGAVYTAPMSTLDDARTAANIATERLNKRGIENYKKENEKYIAEEKKDERNKLLAAASETLTPPTLASLPENVRGEIVTSRMRSGEPNVDNENVTTEELKAFGLTGADIIKPGETPVRKAPPEYVGMPIPYPREAVAPLQKQQLPVEAVAKAEAAAELTPASALTNEDLLGIYNDERAAGTGPGDAATIAMSQASPVITPKKDKSLQALAKRTGIETKGRSDTEIDDAARTLAGYVKPVEYTTQQKEDSKVVVDARLARLEERGETGKPAAAELRRLISDKTFTPDQVVVAFQMADTMSNLLGKTGEIVQIKFLKEVLDQDKVPVAGRYTPTPLGKLTGLIELSLAPGYLSQGADTASHEAFHVISRLFSEFDLKSATIIRAGFAGAKNIDGIDRNLRGILRSNINSAGVSHYQQIKNDMASTIDSMDQATREAELKANVFSALHDITVRGRKSPTMNNAYRRFLNFFSAFSARMGNYLRGNGFNSVADIMGPVSKGEGTAAIAGKVATAPTLPAQPIYSRNPPRGVTAGSTPAAIAQGKLASGRFDTTWGKVQEFFNPRFSIDNISRYETLINLLRGRSYVNQKRAEDLSNIIAKGDKSSRETVYKYLTTQANPSIIINDEIRKAAVQVKQTMNEFADEMVAKGFTSKEDMDKNRGTYLPQLYLKFHADGKGIKTPNFRMTSQEYLKPRTKLTEEEKKLMGLITDPAYLSYVALSRPAHDLAMAQFFQDIATAKGTQWTLPNTTVAWEGKQVGAYYLTNEAAILREMASKTEEAAGKQQMLERAIKADELAKSIPGTPEDMKGYTPLPNTQNYGALRGVPVLNGIYTELTGALGKGVGDKRSIADFLIGSSLVGENSVLGTAHGLWKTGKTVFNIPTQGRNAFSNLIQLHLFAGVPLYQIPGYLTKAVGEMKNNGSFYQDATNNGIHGGTFAQAELNNVQTRLDDYLRSNANGGLTTAFGMARILSKVLKAGTGSYQTIETFFKMAAFIHARENGMNASQAVAHANNSLFDYSLVDPNIRALRTSPFGLPFITFQYKVLPALVKTLYEHPLRFAPYVAMSYAAPQIAMAAFGFDDKDLDKLQKSLPEYARTKGSVYFIPIRDAKGNPSYIDMGPMLPWGSLFDPIKQAVLMGDVSGGLKELGKVLKPGGPLVSALVGGLVDKDPFTGRDIVDKRQTTYNQWLTRLAWVTNQTIPPMLTFDPINPDNSYGAIPKIYNSIFVDGTGLDKKGKPKEDVALAVAALMGFNVKAIDPIRQRADNIKAMEFQINARKGLITQISKDLSIKPEARREQIKQIVDAIKQDTSDLRDYAQSTSGVRRP